MGQKRTSPGSLPGLEIPLEPPFRGINTRAKAIKPGRPWNGEFRHLVNFRPMGNALRKRMGTRMSPSLFPHPAIQPVGTGNHRDVPGRVLKHLSLAGSMLSRVDMFSDPPYSNAFDLRIGVLGTGAFDWESIPKDDPCIQVSYSYSMLYVANSYGRVWEKSFINAGAFAETEGKTGSLDLTDETANCIIGTLPRPIGFFINSKGVPVFAGIRGPDTQLYQTAQPMQPPNGVEATAFVWDRGPGLAPGNYFFAVTAVMESQGGSKPETAAGGTPILSIDVTNGGAGYINPSVAIEGDGTGAQAYASIDAGVITGINITAHGDDYHYANIVIRDSGGTGATATATLGVLAMLGFGPSNAIKVQWNERLGVKRYRVYDLGAGKYWEVEGQTNFTYVGQTPTGTGAPPLVPTASNGYTQFTEDYENCVFFLEPQTMMVPGFTMRLDNFMPLPLNDPADMNDRIVIALEAFGGTVVFRKRSVWFLTGTLPRTGACKATRVASGIGTESPNSVKLCSDGYIYFLDRKGPHRMRGPNPGDIEDLSFGIVDYFRETGIMGSSPLVLNPPNLPYAHAVDDEANKSYRLWLDLSVQTNGARNEAANICLVFNYGVTGREDEKQYWVIDGKAGYNKSVDGSGLINQLEHGYAFASADYIDDGTGVKRMFYGGYDGYSYIDDANSCDAMTEFTADGNSVAAVVVNNELYPGVIAANSLVGAYLEVSDDRTDAERAAVDPVTGGDVPIAGRCVNGSKYLIVDHTDIKYWDPSIATGIVVGAGVVRTSDTSFYVIPSASGKFTCNGPGIGNALFTKTFNPSFDLADGKYISAWFYCNQDVPAGSMQLQAFDGMGMVDSWNVPLIPAGTWTRIWIKNGTGASYNIVTFRAIYVSAINGGVFTFWVDDFEPMPLKKSMITISGTFKNAAGSNVTLQTGAWVKTYWPVAARAVLPEIGDGRFNFLFDTIAGKSKLDGKQYVNFVYTADPKYWAPERMLFAFPSTPDGQVVLDERWPAYWTWATWWGNKENDVFQLGLSPPNRGPMLNVMLEENSIQSFALYSLRLLLRKDSSVMVNAG